MITPRLPKILFPILLCTLTAAYAQTPSKIKVRSGDGTFSFFQKGVAADTISQARHDLFYLYIPADRRCTTRIDVENGQLQKAGSDTVYRLIHVGRINYTHYYADSVSYGDHTFNKKIVRCKNYLVVINGTNDEDPAQVTIRFYDSVKDSLLLTNHFYYR